MVRIGIVGAGSHARVHHGSSLQYLAMNDPDLVELSAVCDLSADRAGSFARQFGFKRTYTDYHEMLKAEKLDALMIITQPEATRPVAGDLLVRNMPLLIEKPPGVDSREAAELLDIATRHRTPHMMSFNRRFIPAVTQAVAWLQKHEKERSGGGSSLVISRIVRNSRREREFLVSTGIHLVDTTLSFLGRPVEVRSRRWSTPEGGQCATGEVSFESGSSAVVALLPDSGVEEETYEIIGPEYSICVETVRGALSIRHGGEEVVRWAPAEEMPSFELIGALAETRAFVESVNGKRPFGPTLADGLRAMHVAEAIERGGTTSIP